MSPFEWSKKYRRIFIATLPISLPIWFVADFVVIYTIIFTVLLVFPIFWIIEKFTDLKYELIYHWNKEDV